MAFQPKMILAGHIEGLDAGRARRFRWRGGLGLAALVLLASLLLWGARDPEKVLSLLRPGPAERLSPAALDVFARMSMLSQPQRAAAPDFFLRTPEGGNRTLSQHGGRVVLLNFWATWCPPCVREMPAMERLYQEYKDRGLDVVAVSVDQGKLDEVREFVAKQKLAEDSSTKAFFLSG
ncbi:MAG: TlpA disulfide reductase family protein, partial [Nitrospinota bacterium]